MSEVAILHKCGRCGKAANLINVTLRGELALKDVPICDDCWDKTEAELAQVRPVYERMIEVGVAPEVASETMTFLLDLMHP